MSDSDETVCGNESGEENTENSPSILNNWHQDEGVLPTEKDEKSQKKDLGKEREEIRNDGGMAPSDVPSPEPDVSPEFPLITRGLKRKESFDGKDSTNPDGDVNDETNTNNNVTESQTIDDDKRLENLLKTVEELVKHMETTSGNTCNLGGLPDVKSQLADIQKLFVESNRKNQVKRKMVLSDTKNGQQIPENKKLMIVNLAKQQRNLLEAFKKYKNLVQRLKAIKDLSQSQRSGQLSESTVQLPSQSHSTSTSKLASVSTTQSPVGKPPNNSVQISIQNSQNQSKSTPRIVLTNAMNPALTKAIQQGSVKFIVLQNQTNISTTSLSQPSSSSGVHPKVSSQSNQSNTTSINATAASVIPRQPAIRRSLSQPSSSSGVHPKVSSQSNQSNTTSINATAASVIPRQPAIRRSSTDAVPLQNSSTAKATPYTGVNNTRASKQSDMTQSGTQNISMRQSVTQIQTAVSRTAPQNTIAPATFAVNLSSMKPRDSQTSTVKIFPPNTKSQNCIPTNNFSTNQASVAKKQPQAVPMTSRSTINQNSFRPSIPRNPSPSVPRQTQPVTNRIVKQIPESHLSLGNLVKKGILAPGTNVLTAKSEGKLYSASLSDKGGIISAGGEGFTSPRSWVKAILGSKRKVKNELAWKMVSYKNKPLLDHASTLTPDPTKPTELSFNRNLESSQTQGPIQDKIARSHTRRELINTTHALKALLSNCRVSGITKEEMLSSDELQKYFWDNIDAELLNDDILKALDF